MGSKHNLVFSKHGHGTIRAARAWRYEDTPCMLLSKYGEENLILNLESQFFWRLSLATCSCFSYIKIILRQVKKEMLLYSYCSDGLCVEKTASQILFFEIHNS